MHGTTLTWFQRWMIALTFAEAGEADYALEWRDTADRTAP